jgi:hypothetical protein
MRLAIRVPPRYVEPLDIARDANARAWEFP